jgi:hypothetical protein
MLLSPSLDFSIAEAPELLFKHAYSFLPGGFYSDTLRIVYSTDCGKTFPDSHVLWEAAGQDLASTLVQRTDFTPSGPGDWMNNAIDLSVLKGLSGVIIAFEGVNGRGNNLYIDDIGLYPDQTPRVDLRLEIAEELPPAYCPGSATITVKVANSGITTVDGFVINYQVWTNMGSVPFPALSMQPLEELEIEIPVSLPQSGVFPLFINVEPLSAAELNPLDNSLNFSSAVVGEVQPVPFREQMESGVPENSLLYASDGSSTWVDWEVVELPRQQTALKLPLEGAEANTYRWVLPAFNLSGLKEASLHFKMGYARDEEKADQVRVLALSECSNTIIELYSFNGADEQLVRTSGWQPGSLDDWQQIYVSLADVVGSNNVLLVIEIESEGIRDLYFDDLEFYTQDIANPVSIPENSIFTYPNPNFGTLNVVFSNTSLKDVTIRFWDIRGIPVHEQRFPDTFNQNYRIDMSLLRPGAYIMEITGPEINYRQRVMRQ